MESDLIIYSSMFIPRTRWGGVTRPPGFPCRGGGGVNFSEGRDDEKPDHLGTEVLFSMADIDIIFKRYFKFVSLSLF